MKQKSSVAASSAPAGQVLLRNLDTQGSKPFAPDHAERLLAYPNTRWAKIDAGNGPAAAVKTAPAAPSEPDETGHPHAV